MFDLIKPIIESSITWTIWIWLALLLGGFILIILGKILAEKKHITFYIISVIGTAMITLVLLIEVSNTYDVLINNGETLAASMIAVLPIMFFIIGCLAVLFPTQNSKEG